MFYLYKITNLINGKIYVGVRSSDDPMRDKYMGSGKRILAAIAKYGVENFQKTILEVYSTAEEAYSAESQIVTEEFLSRDDTYNLNIGGYGGRFYMNAVKTEQERVNLGMLGATAIHARSEEEKKLTYKKISEANSGKKYNSGTFVSPDVTSQKRRDKMLGKKLHPVTRKWVSKEEYDKFIQSQ